jgi:uncharacterized protein (DUF433 family)
MRIHARSALCVRNQDIGIWYLQHNDVDSASQIELFQEVRDISEHCKGVAAAPTDLSVLPAHRYLAAFVLLHFDFFSSRDDFLWGRPGGRARGPALQRGRLARLLCRVPYYRTADRWFHHPRFGTYTENRKNHAAGSKQRLYRTPRRRNYVAGTRIGLDVIVHEFESGKSPESILQSHFPIGSLAKVYGVITFILEHPEEIRAYLTDQERLWEELTEKHPLPPDMLQRFMRWRELLRKPA